MDALNGRRGSSMPTKILMYRAVERHGAQSVLGRTLKPQEAIEMQVITRIEQAHAARNNAQNEANWANSDPGGFKLLVWAERLANGKRS